MYTRGFAERFQLAADSAIQLDPGVLAIALTVEQKNPNPNGCALFLYLDNTVPFQYPPGREARMEDVHPPS